MGYLVYTTNNKNDYYYYNKRDTESLDVYMK